MLEAGNSVGLILRNELRL